MKLQWPWKRKQRTSNCNHKYKDFPLYRDVRWNEVAAKVYLKIYAPYVCVICGHRIDKELYDNVGKNCYGIKSAATWANNQCADFEDKIQHRLIVEEMIADMQLVDRKFLEIAGMLEEPQPTPRLTVNK